MSVYVDAAKLRGPRNRYGGHLTMSHMLADSIEELHRMADEIGVSRRWFQPGSTPHYDVCQSKRAAAIAAGAIPIDRWRLVEKIRAWRARAAP